MPSLVQKDNIYVIAHCLLNPLVRVKGFPVKKQSFEGNIIQLPCPESIYFGKLRWEVSKEQLDFPRYRRFCRELFLPIADILEQLKDYEIIVVGVSKSPSCAAQTTTIGYKGGKVKETKHEHVLGMGIFFEEIEKELKKRRIKVKYHEV